MYPHLGLTTILSAQVSPMDKLLGEATAPDFSKRILARIYVSAQAPSHLVAFGKDVIGASPGHRGKAAKGGNEQRERIDRQLALSREDLSPRMPLPFKAEPRNKEKGMY